MSQKSDKQLQPLLTNREHSFDGCRQNFSSMSYQLAPLYHSFGKESKCFSSENYPQTIRFFITKKLQSNETRRPHGLGHPIGVTKLDKFNRLSRRQPPTYFYSFLGRNITIHENIHQTELREVLLGGLPFP